MTDPKKLTPEEIAAAEKAAADEKAKRDAEDKARLAEAEERRALVKMAKLGHEPSFVHPSCVDSHVVAGWVVVK